MEEEKNTHAQQVSPESDAGNQAKENEAETNPQTNEISHEEQYKELNDKYLRLYSEFDNFRKRTQKEKLELLKFAGEEIISAMLPVLDDFDRAIKNMDEKADFQSMKQGVELIQNKLSNILKAKGLEEVENATGKIFDIDLHEAITQVAVPDETMKGKVIDEVEKGYMLNGKVIRYSKVVVGQ